MLPRSPDATFDLDGVLLPETIRGACPECRNTVVHRAAAMLHGKAVYECPTCGAFSSAADIAAAGRRINQRGECPIRIARRVTADPGFAMLQLAHDDDHRGRWHVWSAVVVGIGNGQTGRELIIRSDSAASVPEGWRDVTRTRDDLFIREAPVHLDALAALNAGTANTNSAAHYVVIRQQPSGRFTVSLGIGSTTWQLRGLHATVEEAETVGRAAVAKEYTRQVDEIRELRGGRLEWGCSLSPSAVHVVRVAHGQNAWDAVAASRQAKKGGVR